MLPTNLWLSEVLEISVEEVDYVLKHMQEAGIVSCDGNDIYKTTYETTNLQGLTVQ